MTFRCLYVKHFSSIVIGLDLTGLAGDFRKSLAFQRSGPHSFSPLFLDYSMYLNVHFHNYPAFFLVELNAIVA